MRTKPRFAIRAVSPCAWQARCSTSRAHLLSRALSPRFS